jgi:hypothetical protein
MPRWLSHILGLLALLLAWVTGRRYRTGPHPATGFAGAQGRGKPFVIVQIDGLSHQALLQALALGHLPYLQLLVGQGWHLQRWRCGLPSSTPATQAGLLYGNNWNIPAFRWYEKREGRTFQCKSPVQVAEINARASLARPGLLRGGSSYTNMLDGEARLALFTLSALGRDRFLEHLRGLGWALLLFVLPWRILRIIAISGYELGRASLLAVGHRRSGSDGAAAGAAGAKRVLKPVLQVVNSVLFGEIATFGMLIDIYRGIPAVFGNFTGYDEVAHGHGLLNRESLRALHRIDRYIHQIDRLRRAYRPETDLYVYSDHGMSASTPFVANPPGQSLGEFVADHVRASVVWDDALGRPGWGSDQAEMSLDGRRWLLDELDGIEANLSGRSRRLAELLRARLAGRLSPPGEAGYDLAKGSDVVVRCSGSMAHLYFNVATERMDVSEIGILYPDLLAALCQHPGVGLVAGLERGIPVAATTRGIVALTTGCLAPGLPEPGQSVKDLERLLGFPSCGDLVVLGAWDALGRVVTFEDQHATHGGLGGDQDYPFFLTPPGAPLVVAGVTDASQLYTYFMARHHGLSVEAARPPANSWFVASTVEDGFAAEPAVRKVPAGDTVAAVP